MYDTVSMLARGVVLAFTADPLLLEVLNDQDRHWREVAPSQVDLPLECPILLPLAGSIRDSQIVVTARDILQLPHRHPILWDHAKTLADRVPLIVLGCDPADKTLRQILYRLRDRSPGWFFSTSAERLKPWEELGWEPVVGPPGTLLRDLVRAAYMSSRPVQRRVSRARRSDEPYKRLDYYERGESDIFFGREAEARRLVDLVSSHRLVIVTGVSGAGKTSLLNAGLLSWVDEHSDYIGLYVRCGDDPFTAVRRELSTIAPDLVRTQTDLDLLPAIRACQTISRRTPIIVVDQAEEFFIRIDDALRDAFFAAIRDSLTTMPIAARFVFSLRDDYLPRLADLRATIPHILQNVISLPEFDRSAATAAIRQPTERFGVAMESGLAEEILDDLGAYRILPPQLQIVCAKLFSEREDRGITRALYQRLGGARKMLAGFLVEELAKFGSLEESARRVLKAMVTSEGTKDSVAAKDVAGRAGLDETTVCDLLFRLRDESRVVRSIVHERSTQFELAHEYLTVEIWRWMSNDEIRRREIEELVVRELRSWRRFDHLRLGLDRLDLFQKEEKLFENSEEVLTLLLLSSVRYQRPATIWIERARTMPAVSQDAIATAIFEYFKASSVVDRREAAEAIALLDAGPLRRALSSHDDRTRGAALEMIGGIELAEAVADVIPLTRDPNVNIRRLACGALGEIGGIDVVKVLTECADSPDQDLAVAAIGALGRCSEPQAVVALGSALASPHHRKRDAAKRAVAEARSHEIVEQLLSASRNLSGSAREALLEGLAAAPKLASRVRWEAWMSLPQQHQDRVVSLTTKWSTGSAKRILEAIVASGGPGGYAARAQLADLTRSESSWKVEHTQVRQLSLGLSSEQIAIEFRREYPHNLAVAHRLADHFATVADRVLDLVGHPDATVRAGTAYVLANVSSEIDLPARALLALMSDNDGTVRYWSCVCVGRRGDTRNIEKLRTLVDDRSGAKFYNKDFGTSVSDAARAALSHVSPNSHVWRKPFQSSFR